jgi:hypothetical protein
MQQMACMAAELFVNQYHEESDGWVPAGFTGITRAED